MSRISLKAYTWKEATSHWKEATLTSLPVPTPLTYFPFSLLSLSSGEPSKVSKLPLMAAPVAEEDSLAVELSDPPLAKNYLGSPNSAEDYSIFAHLTKTSNTRHNDPDAPSSSKRIKSKSIRFEVSPTEVQTEHPPPKMNIPVSKTSSPSLSLKKVKSSTKSSKSPTPTSPAMILATEFQSSLGTEFPSCVKLMGRSQVTQGFWMGLPTPFCRSFMPKEETTFVLEDESGKKWEVKYIAYKNGISAGWKSFVVEHHLIEGDVLVFHLIDAFKFKVYIIKASESNEVDGALSLLNLEAQNDENPPVTPSPKPKKRKHPKKLSLTMVKEKHKKSTPLLVKAIEILEHSGTNNEDIRPEVLEPSTTPFQDLEHFRIKVNGQCIDSELSEEVKLAGMIGETVNIAKEIKNCKLTISKEELEAWDNTLKSFEILGMKVGFLRDKIRTLVGLVFESEFGVDLKRYVEAKKNEKLIEDEIVKVKAKLLELKIKAKGLLGCLKEKAEKYMIEFQDEVDVPW
ncbi:unnamed protein product [Lactuca virosa]|uniref:TF-B3 domain-containing protein n=1 Tax=Lactuca virosa TaxID=75947 RepID=A0AAU9M8Z0_9ASTR|nr:unnamed protein product [Lactuca virosa]